MQQSNNSVHKPIALRVIFILNALMMILPFVFYYVFITNDIRIGNLDPMWMVYTGIAYIISFAILVYFLVKRNVVGARIMFLVNIVIALPTSAYIGMVVAVISLALSFYHKKVLAYFNDSTSTDLQEATV